MLGRFKVVQERIALGQSLPHMRHRQYAPVLGALGKFHRIARRLQCFTSMTPWIWTFPDLFLELAVFHHALQQPRSSDEDKIGLLFADRECALRLFVGAIVVAIIEMQVTAIDVCATQSMMIRVLY